MRPLVPRPLLLVALLASTLAWRASERMALEPRSRLWVEGSSSVRAFSCEATVMHALVDARGPGAVASLLAGERAVDAADLRISAERLDCGNGRRNELMRSALKAHEHPTITFRLGHYDLQRDGDAVTGTLAGTLSLGGVVRPMSITARGQGEGALLHVTGATDVLMSDHALRPPTLLFGRIKVRDRVTVKFDLYLKG